MAEKAPKSKPRRPSLPAPVGYIRRVYGQQQEQAQGTVVVTVTLRPDTAVAVLDLVERHGLSRSGAAHHLIRLGAGLPPLPPLD